MFNVLDINTLTPKERERFKRRALLLEMYESGSSVRDIAEALGVTTQAIYQHLDALGLPSPSQRNGGKE